MIIVGSLLVAYTCFRAYEISFTYDESSTVLTYVGQDYSKIFTDVPKATNHILNTALAKAFSSILPPSELTYRLPNVFAHVLFILFSMLILLNSSQISTTSKLLGFLLLNCNPYMLDFFSLARGYGLGIAFTLGTIYFWLKYARSESVIALFLTLLAASLAVLSNFSLLNLYLGICALYVSTQFLSAVKNKDKYSLNIKAIGVVVLISLGLFFLIKSPLQQLVNSNELFFGGHANFWSDTVMSLIRKSTYSDTPSALAVGSGVVLLFFMLSIIVVGTAKTISNYFKDGVISQSFQLTLLLTIIILGVITQHYLFGTLYLIERTALFLVPIFVLAFIFSIHHLPLLKGRWQALLLAVPTTILTLHTACAMNVTHTLDWRFEQGTKQLMQSLKQQHFKHSVRFGVNWPNTETVYFYRWLYQLNFLQIIENQASTPYPEGKEDPNRFFTEDFRLAYVNQSDLSSFSTSPEVVERHPNGKAVAWFAQPTLKETIHLGEWQAGNLQEINGDEFFGFISDSLSHFADPSQLINMEIEAAIKPKDNPLNLQEIVLVLTIEPGVYRSVWSDTKDIHATQNSMHLYYNEALPTDVSTMKIYIWNIKGQSFIITDFKLTVFSR